MDTKELLKGLLQMAIQYDASDIHLKANAKPYLRVNGKLVAVSDQDLPASTTRALIFETMNQEQIDYVTEHKEVDYAYRPDDNTGFRYRVNAYTAQGNLEAVFRLIKGTVLRSGELQLPSVIDEIAIENNGLILVAGSTGQGKSTTLGAMIDKINSTQSKRIITIENPVEILHKDNMSVISQREVGGDTVSFAVALRSILRQNPDVILIGEIRDMETAEIAMQAAQTGHLVLSTIHAGSAEEAIKRFAGLYPADERPNVKRSLASSLRSIIAQRLVVDVEGNKFPVMEVMKNNHRISQALLQDAEGENGENITKIIYESTIQGMTTLDQYLVKMLLAKKISPEVALGEANEQLSMKQTLHQKGYNL